MFRFANPQYLYLLIVIPLLALIFFVAMRGRRRRMERFANLAFMERLMPNFSLVSVRLKCIMSLVALTLLIFAAARPQVGSKLREVKSRGVEMMLVVDVSNSMLAEDFAPNRLAQTQFAIERLFSGLSNQERVGLIAFAGDAVVELPITSDYRLARAFSERLSPSIVGEQGTNIGRALELALLSFSGLEESSKVIILITDGETHDNNAIAAAERAKMMGIKIFTVGIGTPEGAPITINGEFIKDESGEVVVTKLGEEMLQQLADITEGGYVRATSQSIGLDEVVSAISQMEQKELSTISFEEYGEQYQVLVIVALLLLIVGSFITDRRNAKLRRINIFSDSSSVK